MGKCDIDYTKSDIEKQKIIHLYDELCGTSKGRKPNFSSNWVKTHMFLIFVNVFRSPLA